LDIDKIPKENYSIHILDPNIARYFSIGEISGGIAYVITSELSNIESQLTYLQDFISQMPTKPSHCQEKVNSLSQSVKKLRKITRELSLLIQHSDNEPIRLNPFTEILDTLFGVNPDGSYCLITLNGFNSNPAFTNIASCGFVIILCLLI